MSRTATRAAVAALLCAVSLGGSAVAAEPGSRGDLMKTCMAEWKAKKAAAGGQTPKYTAFISECLKRHGQGAQGVAKPAPNAGQRAPAG